jgi:cytochrome c peroxidase
VLARLLLALLLLAAVGCSSRPKDEAAPPPEPEAPADPEAARVRALMNTAGAAPIRPATKQSDAKIQLGKWLFWDAELSGNRDISCGTCHHPAAFTVDGLTLPVGTKYVVVDGVRRLGEGRTYIGRNTPPMYDRAHDDWRSMFWDGRVTGDPTVGFQRPDRPDYVMTDIDTAMAGQAMYPPQVIPEMRGAKGDVDVHGKANEIALLKKKEVDAIWSALLQRLWAIPAYVDAFEAAYPGKDPTSLDFRAVSNALSAYVGASFSTKTTPFDAFLRGEDAALNEQQRRGAEVYYGVGRCGTCHAGELTSDQQFHNLVVPHVGPGKLSIGAFDHGRANFTKVDADYFGFRTPPLRNAEHTGPWMHNGAMATLEAAVRHHLDPVAAFDAYDPSQLPEYMRTELRSSPEHAADLKARVAPQLKDGIPLDDAQVADVLAFLKAMSDPTIGDWGDLVPESVPSGLAIYEPY